MAAASATLVSLLNTMDQIQIHPLLSTSFNNYPNQSLRKKIDFLLDFVENHSDADICAEAEDLLRRIAVVVHEADEIIQVQAADRVRAAAASTKRGLRKLGKLKKIIAHRVRAATSTPQSGTFWPNLQRVRDDMDSIKEQIIKINEETRNRQPTSSLPSAEDLVRRMAVVAREDDEIIQDQPPDPISDEQSPSLLPDMKFRNEEETGSIKKQPTSSSSPPKTTNMVGFEGYLEQLLDQLTGQHPGRRILPIVGMGGIDGWCGDLTYWIADSSSFPVLEMLSLGYLAKNQFVWMHLFSCHFSSKDCRGTREPWKPRPSPSNHIQI